MALVYTLSKTHLTSCNKLPIRRETQSTQSFPRRERGNKTLYFPSALGLFLCSPNCGRELTSSAEGRDREDRFEQ